MAACSKELRSVKRYCHIDLDDKTDDALLTEDMIPAAKEYLTSAGILPDDESAKYRLAVKGLVLYYYDNRDKAGDGADFPAGLRKLLNQLKADGLVSQAQKEA